MNLLLARYEQCESPHLGSFERRANRLLAALGSDWRRRKALILLARVAERRGDLDTAISLTREAIKASEGIPTRHRLDDQQYLDNLEGMKNGNL